VLAENRLCSFTLEGPEYEQVDKNTMDLLKKMLDVVPEERISAKEALEHSYFEEYLN
jgi:serine/threonine protein kinase